MGVLHESASSSSAGAQEGSTGMWVNDNGWWWGYHHKRPVFVDKENDDRFTTKKKTKRISNAIVVTLGLKAAMLVHFWKVRKWKHPIAKEHMTSDAGVQRFIASRA